MKVAMALDVGTKTIGVAVTDGLGMLAHPVTTVTRRGVQKDCTEIVALMTGRSVGALVVGLPFELDGREERSAKLARQVGEALAARTGLPVYYEDERFSSVEAERRMISAGMRRERRKAIIDQAAAVIILQSWLESGGRANLEGAGG